jgi:hypothetical protein
MKLYGGIAFILAILFPPMCQADWYYDFVRITCIPEARYFQFEAKSIEGSYVLMETQFNEKLKRQRLAAWIKKGYYDPSRLEFKCHMPESTYLIKASQPSPSARGQCGGAPSITLSLYKDGELMIDSVIFGNDCFGRPSVRSVEISDGLQGWDTRQMIVCVSGNLKDSCKFLSETYGDISKAIPIDENKINEYVSQKSE